MEPTSDNPWRSRLYGTEPVPPRCLAGVRCFGIRWETHWEIACACGHRVGELLGHRLGDLKPDFEECDELVSPLHFRCEACAVETPLLDTVIHGSASEYAKGDPGEGCCAYRGEGVGSPAVCPKCSGSWANVRIQLFYDESWLGEIANEIPAFHAEDYFDGFDADIQCVACGHRFTAVNLVLK